MKKFKYLIVYICVVIMSLFVAFPPTLKASAESGANGNNSLEQSISSNIQSFVDAGIENSSVHSRFAGSEGERIAAAKILSKLDTISGIERVNNASTVNGIQSFSVNIDGGLYPSQNIIYRKPGASHDKKVVIATHYDSEGYYEQVEGKYERFGNEGVHSSGAGVGLVFALAEALSSFAFEFDIEFVFFGSHYAELAGSGHYTTVLSEEDAKNTLLMINFDNVVTDGNIYLYTGEYRNKTDSYLNSAFNEVTEAKDAYDYRFIADSSTESVTGLEYTTVALESDSAHFIRRGVKVLNILGVDNECEAGASVINYASKVSAKYDNLSVVHEKYTDSFISILAGMAEGVISILSDVDFVNQMGNAESNGLYAFFGDYKLAGFIAAVTFIVLWFVIYLIRVNLAKKAESAKIACNFDAMIAEMASRTYESVEELVNEAMNKFDSMSQKNKSSKDKKSQKGGNEGSDKGEQGSDTDNDSDEGKTQ